VKIPRWILYGGSAVLSFAAILYIFFTLDWPALRAILLDLEPGWVLLAFGAYFINLVLRAMRFRILLYSREVRLRDLIVVSSLHNMFVYIMPAKSGDVSYILLAKSRLDLPLVEGSATLLAARLFDFTTIAGLLAVVLPLTRNRIPPGLLGPSILFCALVLGGTALLLVLLGSPRAVIEVRSSGRPALDRFVRSWNRLIAGLRLIRARGGHLPVALLTLGIWSCLYADYYFIARALGTQISFLQISTITLVMVPLTLLPFQGFANVGTHELGWAGVLRSFGYSFQDALSIALGSHFILLVIILTYGGLGLLATRLLRQTKEAHGQDPTD
jgi:uncharacterized protein (TIRG00374 family)